MRSLVAFILVFCCTVIHVDAQEKGTVEGTVVNHERMSLPGANVYVLPGRNGTSTNERGAFKLNLNPGEYELVVTFMGYDTIRKNISVEPGVTQNHDFRMRLRSTVIDVVRIEDKRVNREGMIRIDPKTVKTIPGPNNSIERTILFQGMGVSSQNELSSQYNVRGGNFDENLIYINDIAVYRPFLVRSGQQEGLSIVNPDLVSNVSFSSGGFEAQYGDKMSSVLDIKYKVPEERLEGAAEGSLLGGAMYIGTTSPENRFTQIHGLRYRTNQYLLGSLDVNGDYRPAFFDYQGFFTFEQSKRLRWEALLTYSSNLYRFEPQTRTTDFGSISQALRLTVGFQGEELNRYQTAMGSLAMTYFPNEKFRLRVITSAIQSNENETYDITGGYSLDELNRDLGSEEFGDVAFNRGVGGFIQHARNYLNISVGSAEVKGSHYLKKSIIDWGAKTQIENIDDEFSEWELIDSAGYSIPRRPSNEIVLSEVVRSQNKIQTLRFQGYAQFKRSFELRDSSSLHFNAGVRAHQWTIQHNGSSYPQTVFGPRANLRLEPHWNDSLSFRLSWGYYHQPPFYRELRNLEGALDPSVRAQTSIHYVFGFDRYFTGWGRPFKFSAEAYYKHLKNLNPYELDNVRIRYYANNESRGYATGIDMKVNGEFVKGVESWVSLSVMKTMEDVQNDFYYHYFDADGDRTYPGNPFAPVVDSTMIEPGFIPRPTDQRVNFAMFFQDYLPGNPTLKMNVTIIVGTGLPTGPPDYNRYSDTLRMPPYRRVDLGMMKQLIRDPHDKARKDKYRQGFWAGIDNAWLSLEVFNLLQTRNTISYSWIRDVNGNQYGVPNYLTSRQVNLKLRVEF